MHDQDKIVCHHCYAKNGVRAAMPKGHEDFVVGSMRWPKPYDTKQSVESSLESDHPILSSTVSQKVPKDAVPSDPVSRAT